MHFWSVWHEIQGLRPLPRREPPLLLGIRIPVLSVDGRDPQLRRPRADHEHREPRARDPTRRTRVATSGSPATMFRYFRWPERFEDFVWLSQIQQGLAIKTAVTHWRSQEAALSGHALLAAQRHLAGAVRGLRSTTAAGGSCLHYMAKRVLPRRSTVVAVPTPDGRIRPGRRERPAGGPGRDLRHGLPPPRWTAPRARSAQGSPPRVGEAAGTPAPDLDARCASGRRRGPDLSAGRGPTGPMRRRHLRAEALEGLRPARAGPRFRGDDARPRAAGRP